MKRVALAAMLMLMSVEALAAPTTVECIEANKKAQLLRRDGNLRGAREQLSTCGSPSCPAIVRDDCAERMAELERILPTLVFEVTDQAGNDRVDVKVTIDGELLTRKLDGSAIPVDLGEHEFAFELVGEPVVKKRLVIREGDKARHERIVVGQKVAAAPPADVAYWSTPRVAGVVVASVGVVGAIVGTVFGVMASSSWSASTSECSTPAICSNHDQAVTDHDAAVTQGWVSTVAFTLGAVAIVTGAVLFFTAPSGRQKQAAKLFSF